MSETQYVLRVQGNQAYNYGLGEVISDRITLFRTGNYDLSWDEIQDKLRKLSTPKKAY